MSLLYILFISRIPQICMRYLFTFLIYVWSRLNWVAVAHDYIMYQAFHSLLTWSRTVPRYTHERIAKLYVYIYTGIRIYGNALARRPYSSEKRPRSTWQLMPRVCSPRVYFPQNERESQGSSTARICVENFPPTQITSAWGTAVGGVDVEKHNNTRTRTCHAKNHNKNLTYVGIRNKENKSISRLSQHFGISPSHSICQ